MPVGINTTAMKVKWNDVWTPVLALKGDKGDKGDPGEWEPGFGLTLSGDTLSVDTSDIVDWDSLDESIVTSEMTWESADDMLATTQAIADYVAAHGDVVFVERGVATGAEVAQALHDGKQVIAYYDDTATPSTYHQLSFYNLEYAEYDWPITSNFWYNFKFTRLHYEDYEMWTLSDDYDGWKTTPYSVTFATTAQVGDIVNNTQF